MIQKLLWTVVAALAVVQLHAASAVAQTALAPDRLPDEALLPRSRPSSAQLLFIAVTNSDLEVSRGAVLEPDLLSAVSGSRRAEELMRSAQRQIPIGKVLMYSGVGVGLLTLAISVGDLLTRDPGATSTNPAITAVGVTGVLISVALATIGAVIGLNGYHDALDAINAYNDDVADGRLAPDERPVPAREGT